VGFLLALLEKIGLGVFAAWLGHKTDVAKDAGKMEQQRDDAQAGEVSVAAASQVGDASLQRSIADPGSLRQPDPDSRD